MPDYLLDTNVLISWFGGHAGAGRLKELIENPQARLFTSIICVAEFIAGGADADAALLKKIIASGEIEIIPFSDAEQAEAAALIRKTLGLKMPDAIVAAAAVETGAMLVTLDRQFAGKVAGKIKTFDF